MKHALLYAVMLFFTAIGMCLFQRHEANTKMYIYLGIVWGDYIVLQWMLWNAERK